MPTKGEEPRSGGLSLPAHATRPRVLAFIGPTGVGKTTTTAKLAARLSAALGLRVGLVAADWNRVGAIEQLQIYADLMSLPIRVAASPEDVDPAIKELGACEWVLVDTPGRSPREAMSDTGWARFFERRTWLERLLVLSASTREDDLDAAVDGFWGYGPSSLVFTKIDETARLGALVNQAVRTGLPVSFLTNGQQVPDDIIVTTSGAMTELVLSGVS